MRIADRTVSPDRAVTLLADYPRKTLKKYDGRANEELDDWRSFTTADIEATKVIEQRALHPKVAKRILAADLDWDELPPRTTDIADVTPSSPAYDQLSRLYVQLTDIHGVGPAIASKLMYLRWPSAMPIQDSFLSDVYHRRATQVADDLRRQADLPPIAVEQGWRRLYMEAVREDVVANRESGAFAAMREAIHTADGPSRLLLDLSDLRLLDVVMWADEKARR